MSQGCMLPTARAAVAPSCVLGGRLSGLPMEVLQRSLLHHSQAVPATCHKGVLLLDRQGGDWPLAACQDEQSASLPSPCCSTVLHCQIASES